MLTDDKDRQEFLIQFGSHIRALRKAKGLTGVELAKRCFMDKQNIHRLETGQFNPSIFYLSKIARGLDLELEDLVKDFRFTTSEK